MTSPAEDHHLRKRCFAPVVDNRTRLLVLGSLPGEKSLRLQQYYGHPQNRFWHLVGDVLGVDLLRLGYEDRLKQLLANGIGLWDVVAEAQRDGSLDSNIRAHAHNDLLTLIAGLPHLETIAFNGGTAAKLGLRALGEAAARFRILQLPSSSPAFTLAYERKLTQWQAIDTDKQA